MKWTLRVAVLSSLAVLAACAVRLGHSGPVPYTVLAAYEPTDATPEGVATGITAANAGVALLAVRADTAWFLGAARRTGLTLSGPGDADGVFLGFLAGEPVGDTTIVLDYETGRFTLHDALYRVGKDRTLDLMAFRIGAGDAARPLVHRLLRYMATDVDATSAVVIGVAAETEAAADSVASMLAPAFTDVRRCMDRPAARDSARTEGPHMRLFYGPEARLGCDSARALAGPRKPVLAHLAVLR
ncbi:MAG TPA: hypothetical protein VJ957_05750 [Longimicrobiales bacterium]|nr:hypothetical protein [Longimicrobiales bacterium]